MSPLKPKGNESGSQLFAIWTRRFALYIGGFLLILPLPIAGLFQTLVHGNIGQGMGLMIRALALQSLWLLPVAFLAIAGRYWFLRKASPWLSKIRKKATIEQATESLSDIRNIGDLIKPKHFIPETYYREGFIFFGLDDNSEPIYLELDIFLSNHSQIMGPSGSGKGTEFGCILDQLIWQGITVFYSDPKPDKYIPHIMFQRAKAMGRNFVYFSLHDDEPGEWGPFIGGTEHDARERMGAIFGIGKDTGDNSSIHKVRELRMVKDALRKTRTVDGLFEYCELEKEDSRITTELDIWRSYRSVCATSSGFSIAESLKRGDVVYIKGSLTDKVMKSAFKAMMLESVQEIVALEKVDKPRAVWLWDEVSFYVSSETPQSLATIRQFGMVMGLAYQSDKDMTALEDKSINTDYVYNGVNVNCQIKLIYGGWDSNTAKFISELSGTIYKEVTTMTEVEANEAAAETWGKKSTVTKEEEALLSENLIKRLPPKICIFLRPGGLPQLCYTAHVPIEDFNALPNYLKTLSTPTPMPVKAPPKPALQPVMDAAVPSEAGLPPSPFAAPSALVLEKDASPQKKKRQSMKKNPSSKVSNIAETTAPSELGNFFDEIELPPPSDEDLAYVNALMEGSLESFTVVEDHS
jgi:hypothetical protein